MMRNTYGKLMFILQDSQSDTLKHQNNHLDLVKDILTVYSFLECRKSLEMLSDPLIQVASNSIPEISNDRKIEGDRQRLIEAREAAARTLRDKYISGLCL